MVVGFLNEVSHAPIPRNHTGHNRVYRILFDTSIPVAIEAANSLNNLRWARNQADYELNARGFRSRQEAQDWVEEALQVKRCIEECRAEPTRSEIALALNSSSDKAI